MLIQILDEVGTQTPFHTLDLHIESETLTLRELIALRVAEEVERYNAEKIIDHRRLVQLAEDRNHGRSAKRKLTQEDAEKQTYIAWDGFKRNSYFVIVNDRQLTSLDDVITLQNETTVSFLRLTPLVGG